MQHLNNFPSPSSKVESRLLAEYGAIFVTLASPPPRIMFRSRAEVSAFQEMLDTRRMTIGMYPVELQSKAMAALEVAVHQAGAKGISITARSPDSSGRSFDDTVNLWRRNVERGLDHWLELGRISASEVEEIRRVDPIDQVAVVLEMEDSRQIYFSTYFDKSILHSVAAPGASQHLSFLAFDIAEYENEEAAAILGGQGWYRTVVSDLPHFTYLGHKENDLASQGLRDVVRKENNRTYRFWIPDLP